MAYYSRLTPPQLSALDKAIEASFDAQVQALQQQIMIPSVKAAPTDKMPFGQAMQDALDNALALARSLGFKTRDLDGYVGIIDYGEGEETLGVLAHLDVVPTGAGWSVGPFSALIKDGCLWGRGTTDDKGPAYNALYALAAIKEAGIPLKRKVQLILGCDEESGWECMDRFKKTEPLPTLAFSPDGEYPLVYSEKAIVHAQFKAGATGTRLRIASGERPNVVPGEATATLACDVPAMDLPDGFSMQTVKKGDATELTVRGLNAHASTPEAGKNALQMLLKILASLPLDSADMHIVRSLHDAFGMDMHGEALGLDTEDDSGRLTVNPGILQWDDAEILFAYDARVPRALPPERVVARTVEALAPGGLALAEEAIKPGHHIPLDSELVTKLMGVYQAQTGDRKSKPLAIGGGTYARAMPMAVAFGCEFPGAPMLAHMPDERVSLDDMLLNTRIMADAIIALAAE